MNQGKLEVVKQEMARVNVDILVISELKWTGMGKFNSNDHYIYYCGMESKLIQKDSVDSGVQIITQAGPRQSFLFSQGPLPIFVTTFFT